MSEEVKPTTEQASPESVLYGEEKKSDQKQVSSEGETSKKEDGKAAEPSKEEAPKDKGDAKPTEEKKAVPEKYDFKLPEGSLLTSKHLEDLAALAKERGLSQEEAQKLLERDSGVVKSFQDSQLKLVEEHKQKWLEASQSDKEFGGEAFKANAEIAQRAIAKFGSEAFKQELERSGLGNHPELVRTFVRIGKAMSEDSLVVPKTQIVGASKKSAEEIFYGETSK